MYRVLDCVATQHDLRLVALAAVICALSSYTTISLLHHVRRSDARMWWVWLAVSALSTGFGIWATHFIAMLAFSPGVPTAYNVPLTVLSLIIAVVVTGFGLAIALMSRWSAAALLLGGAVVGAGIAAMHYTGMAAFEVPGRINWDASLVDASIAIGAVLAAAALYVGLRGEARRWTLLGTLLLTAAICGLHFTAMGAASVTPDPTIDLSASSVPSGLLAVGVALVSFVVVALALGGVAIDMRDRRREELEGERMRGLANAAVEGLLVCDGDTVVTVNDNFVDVSGYAAVDSVLGTKLERYFPDDDLPASFSSARTRLLRACCAIAMARTYRSNLYSASSMWGENRIMPLLFGISARARKRKEASNFLLTMTPSRGFPIAPASTRSSTTRSPRRWILDSGSPYSFSTSTGSRKSTTSSGTPSATTRCKRLQRASGAPWTAIRYWRD